MTNRLITTLICSIILTACSSAPRIAVDPKSIKNQATYDLAYDDCLVIAQTIDLSNEKAVKGVAGAAIGAISVAGIATAVAGAVFAPAIPFIIGGGLVGGGLWGSSASAEEIEAREGVLRQCLTEKGYKVYGT